MDALVISARQFYSRKVAGRFLESRLLSPLPFSLPSFDKSLCTHLLRTRHRHPLEERIVVPPFPPMAEAGRKMTDCYLLALEPAWLPGTPQDEANAALTMLPLTKQQVLSHGQPCVHIIQ